MEKIREKIGVLRWMSGARNEFLCASFPRHRDALPRGTEGTTIRAKYLNGSLLEDCCIAQKWEVRHVGLGHILVRDVLCVMKQMLARSGWLAKNCSTSLNPDKLITPRRLSCSRPWIHVLMNWCCSAAANMMLIVLPMPMYTGASPAFKNFA